MTINDLIIMLTNAHLSKTSKVYIQVITQDGDTELCDIDEFVVDWEDQVLVLRSTPNY